MKLKSLLVLSLLTLSFSAFAKNISISNPSIEIWRGPEMAAVQPTATLTFNFSSCARFALFVEQQVNEDKTVSLTVQVPDNQMECFGPEVKRGYSIQLTSDYSGERYSVTNTIAPSSK